MAKKMYEQLGEELFNSSEEVSTKNIAKAGFDKSYKTTIVGCNRYFTDDVPAETQAELIKKYNIPEVSESGIYYTFRINGNWYVKSSNNDFKLYEEVVVRVPNGNWDNMFIEVQRGTVGESGGGDGILSAVKIEGNKLFYNGEEYRLQFGNNKRVMCVTKGKLHYIVEAEEAVDSYIEVVSAVISGLTEDCDIEFDAGIIDTSLTYYLGGFTMGEGMIIDWGDGNIVTYPESPPFHRYASSGEYRVKISNIPDVNTAGCNLNYFENFWYCNNETPLTKGMRMYVGGNLRRCTGNNHFATKIVWGEKVEEIGYNYDMGQYISGETVEVPIPPKVKKLLEGACCRNHTNYIYIPPECTLISRSAIYNIPLRKMEIAPDGDILTIETYGCNSLGLYYGTTVVSPLEIPARVNICADAFVDFKTHCVKFERGATKIAKRSLNDVSGQHTGDYGYDSLYLFIPSTVTTIEEEAVSYINRQLVVYYEGSEEEWKSIIAEKWTHTDPENIVMHYRSYQDYNDYFVKKEIKKLYDLKSEIRTYRGGGAIDVTDEAITLKTGNGLKLDVADKLTLSPATKNTIGGIKAGEGVTIEIDGTLNVDGGGGIEYVSGDGIDIAENTISLKTATATNIGGIKIGKGLKVDTDGTVSSESGGSYTAGSGIDITDENAINLKQATGTEIGGIILGEGLEYDSATGKTNTVPNIQQAVIIQEKDATYLLHEYTLVDYIAGNKICYAGVQTPIICNGYVCYVSGTKTPNGIDATTSCSSTDINKLPNPPFYDRMDVIEVRSLTSSSEYATKYTSIVLDIYEQTAYSYRFNIYLKGDGVSVTIASSEYSGILPNMCFVPTYIYAPGYYKWGITYSYGCAEGWICYRYYKDSAYRFTTAKNVLISFASEAEYNAAVGLTYEPNVLKQVNETITEV